eukprot:403334577
MLYQQNIQQPQMFYPAPTQPQFMSTNFQQQMQNMIQTGGYFNQPQNYPQIYNQSESLQDQFYNEQTQQPEIKDPEQIQKLNLEREQMKMKNFFMQNVVQHAFDENGSFYSNAQRQSMQQINQNQQPQQNVLTKNQSLQPQQAEPQPSMSNMQIFEQYGQIKYLPNRKPDNSNIKRRQRSHKSTQPKLFTKPPGTKYNSYLCFCMYYRTELKKLEPKMASRDVSRIIGEKWRMLSKEEQQQWKEEAIKMNIREAEQYQKEQMNLHLATAANLESELDEESSTLKLKKQEMLKCSQNTRTEEDSDLDINNNNHGQENLEGGIPLENNFFGKESVTNPVEAQNAPYMTLFRNSNRDLIEFQEKLCSRQYGLVLGVAALLGLQNYTIAFVTVAPVRSRAFNKEFMSEFETQVKLDMGTLATVPGQGYPDMGAGPFSKKLPYKDWFQFNCAQRIHANSLEQLSWALPALLINGLFFPKFSASMGLVVLVGRELYRYGYMSNDGPNSKIRELGAVPLNAAEMFLLGGIGLMALRYNMGGFIKRRKLVQRWTMKPIDRKIQEVIKEQQKKMNA